MIFWTSLSASLVIFSRLCYNSIQNIVPNFFWWRYASHHIFNLEWIQSLSDWLEVTRPGKHVLICILLAWSTAYIPKSVATTTRSFFLNNPTRMVSLVHHYHRLSHNLILPKINITCMVVIISLGHFHCHNHQFLHFWKMIRILVIVLEMQK